MSTSPRRSPLWFCYECHAEMRPLMVPDPHCASCNGTFLEEMDGTADEDPRQIAAENETSEALLNILSAGLGRSPNGGSRSPRDYRGPGLFPPSSRTRAGNAGSEYNSPFANTPFGGGMPGMGPFQAANMGSASSIRFEVRSGPGGRSWSFQRGNGPSGRGAQDEFPTFQDFMNQRINSAPTSPADDEIETPFGPRFRRPGGPMPAPPLDDPRMMLMQYLMGMLSGNPSMMFEEPGGGPFHGSGAFGDYVFNQEGLDRIVTQLMEAAGQHKPNPAPEELIANLKRTNLTYDCDLVKAGQSCAICTEYFAPPEQSQSQSTSNPSANKDQPIPEENTGQGSSVAITLPCDHSFHDDCIITWLKTSGTCPVCRFALVEQPAATGPGSQPAAPGAASTSAVPPAPAPAAAAAAAASQARANTSINITPNISSTTTSTVPSSGTTGSSNTRPTVERSPTVSSRASEAPSSAQQQAETFFNNYGGPTGVLESIFGFFGGNRGNHADPGAGGHAGRDASSSSAGTSNNATSGSGGANNARSASPPARSFSPTAPRISTPVPNSSSRNVRTPPSTNTRRSPSPSPMPAPPIFFSDRLSPRPGGTGSGGTGSGNGNNNGNSRGEQGNGGTSGGRNYRLEDVD